MRSARAKTLSNLSLSEMCWELKTEEVPAEAAGGTGPPTPSQAFSKDQNAPPNCPPTSVLLVLKLKFYTKIFALYSRR